MKCSICKEEGHTKRTCKKKTIDVKVISPVKVEMTSEEYDFTISEVNSVAKSIGVKKGDGDGRFDSAIKQKPFVKKIEKILLEKHPEWEVVVYLYRKSYHIMVNSIKFSVRITDCKSPDNSMSKPSVYFSITGSNNYPYSSNLNQLHDRLIDAKTKGQIKKHRDKRTELHFLVINKSTGDVLVKAIFDIYNYASNAENTLQINWKNEFKYSEYYTEDVDYSKKVDSLMLCIQKSVKMFYATSDKFANADLRSLITWEE